jgi:SanA protein
MRTRKVWWILAASLASLVGFAVISNVIIANRFDRFIYDSVQEVPPAEVALVLGTGKYARGRVNPYYRFRVEAALALYEAGKVSRFLVSGDGSHPGRSEPEDMRADLVARGVPPEAILVDNGGLRTHDSIVRAQEVFGLERFLVVSQRFHVERALFIAHSRGIPATGFTARDVRQPAHMRVMVRELLARVRAGIDVWVTISSKSTGPAS